MIMPSILLHCQLYFSKDARSTKCLEFYLNGYGDWDNKITLYKGNKQHNGNSFVLKGHRRIIGPAQIVMDHASL